MDSSQLYTLFRKEAYDVAEPYLWDDESVYHYMDEAQRMFCRLTGGLADSSSTFTQLPVVAGEVWTPLDPRILRIRGAYATSDGRYIQVVNYEDLEQAQIRLDGRVDKVQVIILGMDRNKVRFYPTPSENDTISLITYRLPLKAIDDADQKLEIDTQHHRYLLYWMLYLAYSRQDAETFDRGKAEENEKEFEEYCETATIEKGVAMHKTRIVRYGGL